VVLDFDENDAIAGIDIDGDRRLVNLTRLEAVQSPMTFLTIAPE
jgi:hypothetical protein